MRHALRYEGGYERNYPSIKPGQTEFVGDDERPHPIAPWPSGATGLRCGFMEQGGKRFFAVRVAYGDREVLLQHPVRIDPDRHMGGRRFSSEPIAVPDGPAGTLLGDIIAANPDQKGELSALRERIREDLQAEKSR